MKKFLITCISLIAISSSLSANAGTRIDLSGPDIGVRIVENQEFLTDGPNLMALTSTKEGERFFLCKALDDEVCKSAGSIRAFAFLPPCDKSVLQNCIASLYALDEAGKRTEGKFDRFVAEGSANEFPADENYNLPQGKGQGSIWVMPGLKNGAGGEEYYLGARFDMWARAGGGRILENFYPSRMLAGISPVSMKLGDFGMTVASDSTNPSSDGSLNGGVGSRNTSNDPSWKNCIVTETGKCYMATNFPENYRFGLTLKLGATLKGWFHGRIYQPVVTTKSLNHGGGEEINIEALPVIVPTVEERIPTSQVIDDLRNFLGSNEVANGFGYVMPESSGPKSLEHTKMWIPLIKDKATTSLTYWSVRTLDGNQDPIIEKCTKSDGDLSGIVTTNSLVYKPGPPEFDKSSQNLNYQVLSPHYAANGELAKGTYDLILSSTVARCIYGFTKAPISASLTILSEDGAPQVATQVINEKNGWLTLSAAGFTYSSPTIKVKLTQNIIAPAPSPSVTSKTPNSAQTKKTIYCSKGKTSKKITAVNPKCPAGYKKKG